MIKPWLFEFSPELGSPSVEPNAQDVAALFGRYLDLWVRDEALGFEGIFFSEHHFGRSYSPSPNLLIAVVFQSAPFTAYIAPTASTALDDRHQRRVGKARRSTPSKDQHWL